MTTFSIASDSAAYTNSIGQAAGTNTSNITSALVRAGYGQGQNTVGPDAANRSLWLDVFGGEIITAYAMNTIMEPLHTVKTLSGARSWRFPRTWEVSVQYTKPGQEMLGGDFVTGELTINADEFLSFGRGFADIDTLFQHFDVRAEVSRQAGLAMARHFDQNVMRAVIQTARVTYDQTNALTPWPGGMVIKNIDLAGTDANFAATNLGNGNNQTYGEAWLQAIRQANLALTKKRVPLENRYMVVGPEIFDAIKYSKNSAGNYMFMDKFVDVGPVGAGNLSNYGPGANAAASLRLHDVTIMSSLNLPTADDSSDSIVYEKYRADYSKTVGFMWYPQAVATVKVAGMKFEQFRDVRRKEDFIRADMIVGHNAYRPEAAVEFRTADLTGTDIAPSFKAAIAP